MRGSSLRFLLATPAPRSGRIPLPLKLAIPAIITVAGVSTSVLVRSSPDRQDHPASTVAQPPSRGFTLADLDRFTLKVSDLPPGHRFIESDALDTQGLKCVAKRPPMQQFLDKIDDLGLQGCTVSKTIKSSLKASLGPSSIISSAYLFATNGAASQALPHLREFLAYSGNITQGGRTVQSAIEEVQVPGVGDEVLAGMRLVAGPARITSLVWRLGNVAVSTVGAAPAAELSDATLLNVVRTLEARGQR